MAKMSARRVSRKRANLLKRIMRGAHKAGTPAPGHGKWRDEYVNAEPGSIGSTDVHWSADGRVLTDHNKVMQATNGLRDEITRHLGAYWGEANLRPKTKAPTNRWF